MNDKLLAYGGDYQQQLKALDIQNGSLTDKQNTLKELAKSELSSFEDQKKKELEKKAKDKFKNLF